MEPTAMNRKSSKQGIRSYLAASCQRRSWGAGQHKNKRQGRGNARTANRQAWQGETSS